MIDEQGRQIIDAWCRNRSGATDRNIALEAKGFGFNPRRGTLARPEFVLAVRALHVGPLLRAGGLIGHKERPDQLDQGAVDCYCSKNEQGHPWSSG